MQQYAARAAAVSSSSSSEAYLVKERERRRGEVSMETGELPAVAGVPLARGAGGVPGAIVALPPALPPGPHRIRRRLHRIPHRIPRHRLARRPRPLWHTLPVLLGRGKFSRSEKGHRENLNTCLNLPTCSRHPICTPGRCSCTWRRARHGRTCSNLRTSPNRGPCPRSA